MKYLVAPAQWAVAIGLNATVIITYDDWMIDVCRASASSYSARSESRGGVSPTRKQPFLPVWRMYAPKFADFEVIDSPSSGNRLFSGTDSDVSPVLTVKRAPGYAQIYASMCVVHVGTSYFLVGTRSCFARTSRTQNYVAAMPPIR